MAASWRSSSVAESLDKKHRSFSNEKRTGKHEGPLPKKALPKKKIQKKRKEESPRYYEEPRSLGWAVTISVRSLHRHSNEPPKYPSLKSLEHAYSEKRMAVAKKAVNRKHISGVSFGLPFGHYKQQPPVKKQPSPVLRELSNHNSRDRDRQHSKDYSKDRISNYISSRGNSRQAS